MGEFRPELPLRKAAFLGAFLPRRSRASQVTTCLCNAFAAEFGDCECLAVAMSDVLYRYSYPTRVRFEIAQAEQNAYRAAAEFLNLNGVDVACILYDFGIFDGEAGGFVLEFARALHMPVVSAFLYVQEAPDAAQHQVIAELARLSSQVIVYQPGAASTLQREYGVAEEKVALMRLPDVEEAGPVENDQVWRELAHGFMSSFHKGQQVAARRMAQQITGEGMVPVTGSAQEIVSGDDPGAEALPVLKLDHFLRMTDETGLLKASVLSLPDYRQGYTTADNARALMFSLLLEQVGEGPFIPIEMQASRHLAFLWNAFNPERGRFRDAMSYRRDWLDEAGSEDTHGLALWALGTVLGRSSHPGMQGVARRLFEAALPEAKQFSSLRAWAFSLLGIQEYLDHFSGDRVVARTGRLLLDRLVNLYREFSTPNWPWFEEALTGSSASVAQALIASARWVGDHQAAEIGLRSLAWLAGLQFREDGMYAPLGDPGYHRRGGQAARFVQRPIEARTMIAACLEAYRYSGDERWLNDARGAFQWFLGRNDLGRPLYDPDTGGCCNGLTPGNVDQNFSAEALLAFLMAQLEMRLFAQLYRQRISTGPRLPILHIGSPNSLIHPSDRQAGMPGD